MKNTYDFVSATCAPVPFIAVVWGRMVLIRGPRCSRSKSETISMLLSSACSAWVHVANQQGHCADRLVGDEVTVFDLPSITYMTASQKPMVLPEAFNDEAVRRVV